MISQFNGEDHLDQSKVIDNSYILLKIESFLISINIYVLHFLEKNVRGIYPGLFNIAILTFITAVVLTSHSFQLHDMTYVHAKLVDFNAAETFPFFDLGKPDHDSPSSNRGFDQHEGTRLQVSYPHNWTKETVPLVKYTGLRHYKRQLQATHLLTLAKVILVISQRKEYYIQVI